MKYKAIIFLAAVVTLAACVAGNKVVYEFPQAMPETVKSEFKKACEKGKVLYDLNCSGCHNITRGKKQYIPDFTPGQLKGYEIRVSNAQHEENMPDEKVTAEELGLISTFLLYKKKNGMPFK